jgi:hypothetical protein
MPRKKKVDNVSEQIERLESQVRMDGVGEDPAVKALVDGTFEKASNLNALDISLMLQQIVRGQTSILHNQDQQAQELAKLREKMDRYDKDAEKWEKDKEKFIDEVNKRAEEFRIDDPNKKAQLIAQEAQRIQKAISATRAENSVSALQFESFLASQPKEIVVSPGVPTTVNDNGVQRSIMVADEIKIKHRKWILQPGVPTEVPKLVADEFRQRQKARQELYERTALLNATVPKDNMVVAQEWSKISKKYGSGGDEFRGDSR